MFTTKLLKRNPSDIPLPPLESRIKIPKEGQTALLEMDQFHGKCLQTLEKKLMRVNLLSKVLQVRRQSESCMGLI